MDLQKQLEPYFTQRPNRMVKDLPMEEYQRWQGINSSLLRENTPWEMLCKLRATMELSPEMRHLVEIQGGDAGTAMQYLQDEKPRMVPRFFATFVRMPEKSEKPSKPQLAIVEQIRDAEAPVDTREFNSTSLHNCREKGWISVHTKEVEEQGISEEVKHGRIEALQEGRCLHAAVLEPHLFDSGEWEKHWQLSPTKSLCSKKAMEAQAEDPTRELITPEIINTARRSRDAVWKHKEAARLLLEPGDSEVSFEVWDDVMQCMRKFRIDRLAHNKQVPVLDVKKTRKGLSDGELRNTIRQYGLGVQGAYYMDGLGFYGAARTGYCLIFVTDCEPYMCRVVEINKHEEWQSFICDGRGIYANRLDKFCLNYREGCQFEAFENEGQYPLHNGRTQP
jgi:hypothetical protein